MHAKLINFILLTFFLLPATGYAKLNEPIIASSESCKTNVNNDELLKKGIFLCELSQFNLSSNPFSNISNKQSLTKIIIKVTGQHPSLLHGEWDKLEKWNIGNADIYLLNSNGIILDKFKPQFDIPHNLYFSTADDFSIQTHQFKFNEVPKPIEIKESILKFEANKSLSLLGGEIQSLDSSFILPDGNIYMIAAQSKGYVNIIENTDYKAFFDKLADIEIKRKVYRLHDKLKIKENPCDFPSAAGKNADIDLTGEGGGFAFLRAHNLILDNGWIFSDTKCSLDGKGIDIEVNNNLELKKAGRITTDAMDDSTGKGGNIRIKAGNQIILDSYTFEKYKYKEKIKDNTNFYFDQMFSTIATNVYARGKGGNINLEAKQLIMKNRAAIQAIIDSGSSGDGGSVNIHTESSIELEDYSQINMFAIEGAKGNLGRLQLKTHFLKLQDSVVRLQNRGYGQGGNLFINATNMDIFNTDKNLAWIHKKCRSSKINNTTLENTNSSKPQASILGFVKHNAKKASNICIHIKNLTLSEGAYIDISSRNQAKGGDISINADNIVLKGEVCPSRIISATIHDGDGGNINLNVQNQLLIKQGSAIIASSYCSANKKLSVKSCNAELQSSQIEETGISGNINITGKYLSIDNDSRITVKSSNRKKAGNIDLIFDDIKVQNKSRINAASDITGGGNIQIKLKQQLELSDNSQITASTSKSHEQYSGGNIYIKPAEDNQAIKAIILSNESNIIANAYKGKGGDIFIKTNVLIKSDNSKIDASSKLGIDGTERIEQLDVGFAQKIITQPLAFESHKSTSFRPCSKQEQNKLLILEQEFLISHPFIINTPIPFPKQKSTANKQQQNTPKNNLYLQPIEAPFEVKKIITIGKTHFLQEITKIIKKQNLPKKLSRQELLAIQDEIQALYDEYYNSAFEGYDKGQIYSTHNTVRIPNQNINDGIVEFHITEEQLAEIQFLKKEDEEQLPFYPNFIKSHLSTGSIFRTQKLHQVLQKLLNQGIIGKFDARLQTGQKASEKILYIHLTEGQFKSSQKQSMVEHYNQLCRGDYSYNILVNNVKKWYRDLLLNRKNTRLESFIAQEKYEEHDLDVKSQNNQHKLSLNQPIYEKQKNTAWGIRSKEAMSLSIQVKKQGLKTKVKQKLFNMFPSMLGGCKQQYSYAIGQHWLKAYEEDSYSEQIDSRFEVAIKASKQAKILHYQRDKKWNANAHWKLNLQLANQHNNFLNHFALKNNNAIRGYSEHKYAGNNGVSSRFNLQFLSHPKALYFSMGFFFDIGSVWKMSKSDTELLKTLWNQRKQQLSKSISIYPYPYAGKDQKSPQYVEELNQSFWSKQASTQLANILQNHWQQNWNACHEIFGKQFKIDMNKLNQLDIYQKDELGNQCHLQLLASIGIQLNWKISDIPITWVFAKKLF